MYLWPGKNFTSESGVKVKPSHELQKVGEKTIVKAGFSESSGRLIRQVETGNM